MEMIRSPSAIARDSGFSTTTPHPSLLTYPSASASNDLQYPSGDNAFVLHKLTENDGVSIRFTPQTIANSDSPSRMFWQAKLNATSDDEQAVSTEMLAPCNPKK